QLDGQFGGDAAGGGIWSSGTLRLDGDTALQANQAVGGQGGAAGVVFVTHVGYVYGNGGAGGGGLGGGLYETGSTVSLAYSSLTGNTATGGAGGGTNPAYGLGGDR